MTRSSLLLGISLSLLIGIVCGGGFVVFTAVDPPANVNMAVTIKNADSMKSVDASNMASFNLSFSKVADADFKLLALTGERKKKDVREQNQLFDKADDFTKFNQQGDGYFETGKLDFAFAGIPVGQFDCPDVQFMTIRF